MKIIYPTPEGIAIVCPAMDCGIPIGEIARKDVPAGAPYLIVEDDALPTDIAMLDAKVFDFFAPHGHGIGAAAWFAEQDRLAAELAARQESEAFAARVLGATMPDK